ncbi:MAG: prolyl oligopeptidase family serine peptidase [Candidatus Zhuqueibacterota bacterium]
MKNIRLTCSVIILLLSFSILLSEETKTDSPKIMIGKWLQLGPISSPLPAFHSAPDVKGKKFELENMLTGSLVNSEDWWPGAGETFQWDKATVLTWREVAADTAGFVSAAPRDTANPEIVFWVSYTEVARWMKATIEVASPHLLQVSVDGAVLASKTSSDATPDSAKKSAPGQISKEVKLEQGKHIVLIKALKNPACKNPWTMKACLSPAKDWTADDVTLSVSPKRSVDLALVLDGPKVSSVSISPDGELVALSLNRTLPPGDNSESWIELRAAREGKLLQTYRGGMKLGRVAWSPAGRKFAYTTSEKEGSTLWIVDLLTGTSSPLLENVKEMGGFSWAPDGSFIIYEISESPESDKTGLKKLKGMADRWPGWRSRSFLYLVNVPEGTRRKLTHGHLSTSLHSISNTGDRLLFSRSVDDFTERPYSRNEMWVLNLKSMTLDSLWTTRWGASAQWSPDDTKLLVTGGPSLFGEIGLNLPDTMIPNDYDTQAYIYDLATKAIEPITKNFNPSIGGAFWSYSERCIYFNTTDKSYQHLYRYDLTKMKFDYIDTGIEVLSDIDFSLKTPVAVYAGTSASVPPKAYFMDLKKKSHRVIADPGQSRFEDVVFDPVEDWTFVNQRGAVIDGCVYYPPNFDRTKKYPCIVYYYGGTSPVTRDFGGRYPKSLYAANGYVVYVLQPSGATGFGQEFSALHVNDWGIIVADEIIDGVKKFLDASPFVDRERVGCIGASYGGFMTMLLQTRTDIFATAISHAGISSISSYWGEGYWGYLYSAVATANSFPWNRKDIYVEQSALFNADKINTPLLLLHGAEDTNVPPGESYQLYAALKLLGKEVELIEIEGQNHHIMQYTKRVRWTKTIMAWFDKWLKDQPKWWNDLYPEE